MAKTRLRRRLDRAAGWDEVELVIPYPFLPMRLRKEARRRNLLLVLSEERKLRLRWEGEQTSPEEPLLPAKAIRLLREARKAIALYRQEADVFERFLDNLSKASEEEESSRSCVEEAANQSESARLARDNQPKDS